MREIVNRLKYIHLDTLSTAGYICSPSHAVDRADQVVSLIVEDLEHPRVGEDPNNADSGVYHPNPGQMMEPFPPAPFKMETRYKFIVVNSLLIDYLRI